MERTYRITFYTINYFIIDKKSLQGSCCTSSHPYEIFDSAYHNYFSKLDVMNPFQLETSRAILRTFILPSDKYLDTCLHCFAFPSPFSFLRPPPQKSKKQKQKS